MKGLKIDIYFFFILFQALTSLHAFTGCDSTSSMCGIGKVKCYRMIEDDTYLKAITMLGESLYMLEQTEKLREEYVSFVWKFNGRWY